MSRSILSPALLLVLVASCGGPAHTPMSERARGFLEASDFAWKSIRSANARIHYLDDGFASGRADALAGRVEGSLEHVLQTLEIPEFGGTLDVFYVDDRSDMERLTGFSVTGMSYARDHTIVLVFNEDWRAFERHEVTHVISRSVWGDPGPPVDAMLEGLAVFVDGDCGGYSIGSVARAMNDRELIIALDRLFASFREQDDLVAYLQAGSLLGFVTETAGGEGLRAVWSEGLAAAPRVAGLEPPELERRWLLWLESNWEPVPDGAWRRIREEGCGIDARLPGRAPGR